MQGRNGDWNQEDGSGGDKREQNSGCLLKVHLLDVLFNNWNGGWEGHQG